MPMPRIEGTYELTHRELPDGSRVDPPDVMGMLSFSQSIRNFSVVWKDEEGRFYSECYVARYSLSSDRYSETQLYLMVHDEIDDGGMLYDLSPKTASSPVSLEGDRLRFDLPQPFEKKLSISVEFRGNQLVATGKGLFVDFWKRVE